jgi:parallel beta-helix repeat protein
MNKTNLLLVIIILSAAFFCASTGVASAISLSDKYVGNTVVDLEWSKYWSDDFSKYKLYRDDALIHTEFNRSTTFYRDEGPSKGATRMYKIEVYNATGGLTEYDIESVTTGEVRSTMDDHIRSLQDEQCPPGSYPCNCGGSPCQCPCYNPELEEYVGFLQCKLGDYLERDTTLTKDYTGDTSFRLAGGVTLNCAGHTLERGGVSSSENGVTIKNCTIMRSEGPGAQYGIKLSGSNGSTITGNTIESFQAGIYLINSDTCTITGNTAANSSRGVGIYLKNSDTCTITGNTANSNRWEGIYLRGSNDNTIAKNVAKSNDCGIRLQDSGNNTLTGNMPNSNTWKGIWLSFSDGNTLANNNVYSNGVQGEYGYGIWIQFSDDNTLTGNSATSNYEGIHLDSSSQSTLTGNTMSGNDWNFGVDGGTLSDFIQDIDTSNTVDERPIYYWVDKQDQQIPGDAGFVGIVDSSNITVKNLALTHNYEGVLLAYSTNSAIESITTQNTRYGIYLHNSKDSNVTNTAETSNEWAIYLRSSDYNTLTNNDASNNGEASIYLKRSCYNNLTGNTVNYNEEEGIELYDNSNNNNLTGNTVNYNKFEGIFLWNSSCNDFIGNNVCYNEMEGIELRKGSNNNLTNNTINYNKFEGIWTEEGVVIRDDKLTNNGKGGIFSVKGDVIIKGTGNEITNNGGDGISVLKGDVTIEGNTTIIDNAGWGIYTEGGHVSINALLMSAQLSKVNNNGKGGIRADAVIGEGGYPAGTGRRPRHRGQGWGQTGICPYSQQSRDGY